MQLKEVLSCQHCSNVTKLAYEGLNVLEKESLLMGSPLGGEELEYLGNEFGGRA